MVEATYYKDDVVRYGGKTFMCVLGHIAQTDFMLDSNDSHPNGNSLQTVKLGEVTGQLEQFTKLMILLSMADNFTLQIQDTFSDQVLLVVWKVT